MIDLTFKQTGYGQWSVSTMHRGKKISMHFTDAPLYDLIKSEKRGYKSAAKILRSRIIRDSKV